MSSSTNNRPVVTAAHIQKSVKQKSVRQNSAKKEQVLSPHLQIWRWTATMFVSITQRVTGIALYAGTILLTFWLASAALGPETYAKVQGLFASPFGVFVLFGYTWAISFHMLNGIKYLFADAGKGLERDFAKKIAWTVIVGSLSLTAIIWGAGSTLGGV